jgi:hypothetical protein
MRKLTMDDVSEVYALTPKQREDLARPVLVALRAIPAISESRRDALGIATDRASRLYEQAIENTTHSVLAIAAARHAMVFGGAGMIAISAIECANVEEGATR